MERCIYQPQLIEQGTQLYLHPMQFDPLSKKGCTCRQCRYGQNRVKAKGTVPKEVYDGDTFVQSMKELSRVNLKWKL